MANEPRPYLGIMRRVHCALTGHVWDTTKTPWRCHWCGRDR